VATEKQVQFMQKLTTERVATNAQGERDPEGRTVADILALLGEEQVTTYWQRIREMSVNEVSAKIDRLLAAPKAQAPAQANGGGRALPSVPEGHYAVSSGTGNNDLDFYRVDRPTEGRWAGMVFVKRVIGGRPDIRLDFGQTKAALEAIEAEGPEAAAVRYGQEIGRCYRCNRHLTDETSRTLGIGPECRRIVGAA
jgi:hypothetical protein